MKLLESLIVYILLLVTLAVLNLSSFFALFIFLALLLLGRKFDKKNQFACVLLGVITPLYPWFGSGTLLAAALIFLIHNKNDFSSEPCNWSYPFLLICAGWVTAEILLLFPYAELLAINKKFNTASEVLFVFDNWLNKSPPVLFLAAIQFARYMVIAFLFAYFVGNKDKSVGFLKGIGAGLCLSLLLSFLAYFGFESFVSANQNSYWNKIGRFSGTFTDPNALGIFIALIAPVLFAFSAGLNKTLKKYALYAFISVLLFCALYSGSRSLVVALVIYLTWLLYTRSKQLLFSMLAFAMICIFLFNVSVDSPDKYLADLELPGSIERVLASIHVSSLPGSLESRVVFSKLSFSIWLQHPIIGVGLGMFNQLVVPYAHWLGIATDLWVDNPNNFYLAILVELGVLGALALLYCLRDMRWSSSKDPFVIAAKLSLVVLVILLLLGPHLAFDEIAVLTAVILSMSVIADSKTLSSKTYFLIFIISIFLGLYRVRNLDQGFYAWERDSISYFRWTQARAWGKLPCNENGLATLRLEAANPGLNNRNPVIVTLSTRGNAESIRLFDHSEKVREVRCESGDHEVFYDLAVSRVLVPSRDINNNSDPRILGVKLRTGKPVGVAVLK